jgi:Uma2 family endonuclease
MSTAAVAEYGPHTIDDYFALGGDTDQSYELINGWIVVKGSPTPLHNFVQFKLMTALEKLLPPGYRLNSDVDVTMADRHQCLRPDVIITTEQQAISMDPVPANEILLAVEIISPSSQQTDRVTKPRIYAAAGVQTYWLVETGPFAITEFRLVGRWYEEVQRVTGDEIVVGQPFDLKVDLSEARAATIQAASQHRRKS